MTLADLIARALRRAHIVADGETPDDEQAHPAVETLNDMLEGWREDGVDLGLPEFTEADYDGGTVTVDVDRAALRAIQYNLSMEASNDAGREITKLTAKIASDTYGSLAARFTPTKRVRFDAALTHGRRFHVRKI